jgi:hypothetical protein
MTRAPWRLALSSCLLLACDDGVLRAFEPSAPVGGGGAAGSGAEAGGGAGAEAAVSGSGAQVGGGGAGGTEPNPVAGGGQNPTLPLLIDDFEDVDSRAEEPLGWWYVFNDKTSMTQGWAIQPLNRGTDNAYVLWTWGEEFQGWGAGVGVDVTANGVPLDLRGYEQLCFQARVEAPGSTPIEVHLLRETPHYIAQVSLSDTWSRYCVRFVELLGPGGEPLVPEGLTALQFFFLPNVPFQFWLDDIEVVP